MLLLTLTPGEYFTVGDDIIVQAHRMEGGRCRIAVEAPREVPIIRGAVRERRGEPRPDCLLPPPEERRHKWVLWDQGKEDSVRAIQAILDRLDAPDADIQALRGHLERLARQEAGEEK